MISHTPGPWSHERVLRSGPHDAPFLCLFAHGEVLGRAYKPDADGQSAEANARLMAAAPDLLAALKLLTKAANKHPDDCTPNLAKALEAARAAIAKARGE
jgi:hypothetical protein